MPVTALHLIDLLRARGRMPAREVLSALGISQPSLSRLTRTAGDHVLQIGRARATRYALAREVRTFGNAWPVYRIDVEGAEPARLCEVHTHVLPHQACA